MKKVPITKAIKLKCLECSCNQISEVKECTIKSCPLWFYRMGEKETKENKKSLIK